MNFRHAVLTLLLLFLTACAGVDSYRDPIRVTVSGIQVLESTLLEQLYLVTLRIQNHNEEPISIRGGSFDLEINGKDFGSGVTDQAVTVPGYSDAKVEVRMVSTVFGMLRLIQSMRERTDQSMQYEISGRLSAEGVLGGLPFREEGEISLPDRSSERRVQ
ncbi:MAG: LEA type 2 family protein [Gammaproteobacteria bacterium]|jgi:LEA14-like dessication related protein|nr:LEA type 2 family protein [Gammaproteobacteria bacterium]